ncbi:MAG: class I SAM-dependent methyltransferase [Phycisphaerales bacterium]|nr:class I SAM-dependent methyltransferase [Phycisphaerales bacterium]
MGRRSSTKRRQGGKKRTSDRGTRAQEVKSKKKQKGPRLADTLDRHVLYQHSVQGVEAEIDFVEETYKALRGGRLPKVLREDFCGTAHTSCEFVKRHPENRAIGVDIDGPTLEWGREHNVNTLKGDGADRVQLLQHDVMTVQTEPADVIMAMNFSYFLWKTRDDLRNYFKRVRAGLKDDGMFICDCYGGSESYQEVTDVKEVEPEDGVTPNFDYIWEQEHFNPITGEMRCKIHFKFKDKSKMRDAFVYEWRMWSLPELREVMLEAGFSKATVYWEGTDEDDPEEGNGEFTPTMEGEADPAWVCYIVAER